MPLRTRLMLAGIGLATLHGGLAVVGLAALGSGRLATFFGLCAALTASLTLVARPLLRPPAGGGGGGRSGTEEPSPPPWWPEFERDFRSYSNDARHPRAPRERTPA